MAVLNFTALRHITGGDVQLECELATLYMATANRCLARLQSLMAGDNAKEWEETLHELRGASGSMGAEQLAHICKRAQGAFDDTALRQDSIKEIEAGYQILLPTLKAMAQPK